MKVEVVIAAGATIGESPTWTAEEGALYWIDVKEPALYRYEPTSGDRRSWIMPSDIGAFALVSGPPGAVVALRQGIFRLDFASGALTRLALPPFDPALFRFNEGTCDSAGRFWVGVMFDRIASPEMLPRPDPLPHSTCSRPECIGRGRQWGRSAWRQRMSWWVHWRGDTWRATARSGDASWMNSWR